MRFTRAELESFRDAEVPDLLGPGTRLLFAGINPGLRTAATQTHFGNPGNRFWPALHRAGILPDPVDVSDPMTDEVRAALVARGIGISNLVRRATARADELTAAELHEGAARLVELVERVRPRVVAVLGITAYRTAFGLPRAVARTPARAPRRRRALGGAEPERAQRARDDRQPGGGVRRAGPGRRAAAGGVTQPSSPVAGSRSVMQYGSPAGSVSTVQNSSRRQLGGSSSGHEARAEADGGGLRLAVGRAEVEVRGDGAVLPVEPLQQQVERSGSAGHPHPGELRPALEHVDAAARQRGPPLGLRLERRAGDVDAHLVDAAATYPRERRGRGYGRDVRRRGGARARPGVPAAGRTTRWAGSSADPVTADQNDVVARHVGRLDLQRRADPEDHAPTVVVVAGRMGA